MIHFIEFKTQFDLKISQEQVIQVISDLKQQKESLSKALQDMTVLSDNLDKWIEEKEKSSANNSIDSHMQAYDAVSDQLIRWHAEQMASEDTLYKLDSGIASDKKHPTLTLDNFIQQTRKLSRQHFVAKYNIEKINSKITINNNMNS